MFVWGKNHFGQLGINNNNNNNNNHKNNINSSTNENRIESQNEPNDALKADDWNGKDNISKGDIITKPTCVKSLKNLGLKIADIAFGQDWSIILTRKYCYDSD